MSAAATWLIVVAIALGAWLHFSISGPGRYVWARGRVRRVNRVMLFLAGMLLLIGVWYLAAMTAPTGPTRIPTPVATLRAAFDLLSSGTLFDIGLSITRVLVGFFLAAAISIPTALVAGTLSSASFSVVPIFSFLRYVPPTAFTALLIIYFGIGVEYQLAVIFFGVFFFNLRMTIDIVEDLDTRYIDLVTVIGGAQKSLHFGRLMNMVVWPYCGPRIWDMMRINISFAWTFLVIAETVGADRGLGRSLVMSQRFLRIEDVYACILLFGVLGLLTDLAMAYSKKMLFRWHTETVTR